MERLQINVQVTNVYVGTLEKWKGKNPYPIFGSNVKTDDAYTYQERIKEFIIHIVSLSGRAGELPSSLKMA